MRAGELDSRFQLEAIVFCIQRQLGNQAKGCADRIVNRLREELDSTEKDEEEKKTTAALELRKPICSPIESTKPSRF